MTRTRRQRGGALEPLRTVPSAFKYTEDPKRIRSIQLLYPYLPYFFSIVKEIPWAEFTSEQEGYTAKCPDIPYILVGGATYEAYDILFPDNVPLAKNILDPTSDIDLLIRPLMITSSDPSDVRTYPFTVKDTTGAITFSPMYNDFTKWLASHFADKLKKLSYNFPEWFGDIAKPTKDMLQLLQSVDRRIVYAEVINIHPVYVTRTVSNEGTTAVQIYLYDGEALITFIECLFWYFSKTNTPASNIIAQHFIPYSDRETILTPDGIRINSFSYELSLQQDSLKNRLPLLGYLYGQHKYYNHFYRTIYLLSQIENIIQTFPITHPHRLEAQRSIIHNLTDILVTMDENSTTHPDDDVKERLQTEILPKIVQEICKYQGILNLLKPFKENNDVLEKYGCNLKKRKSMTGGGKVSRQTSRKKRETKHKNK